MSKVIEEAIDDEGILLDCVEVQLEKLELINEDQKKEIELEPQATGGWNVEALPQASGGWDFSATSEKQPQEQKTKFEMSNAWGVQETTPQDPQVNVLPSSQWATNNYEQINQSNTGWNVEPTQTGWQSESANEKQSENLTQAWGESWGGLAELPVREQDSNQSERGSGRGRGGPRVCFKCQQEGHMSRDCQNQITGQRNCYKCGQEGHMSRDCTEPGQARGRGRGRGQQLRQDQQNESWGQGTTEAQNSWETLQEAKEPTSWQQAESTNEVPNNAWGSNDQQTKLELNNTSSWGASDIQVSNAENTWNNPIENNQNQSWDSNAWGGNQEQTNGDNVQNNESRDNNRGRGRGRGRGEGGGSRACFKCQQEGHMSRECPNAPTQQSRACFKCQQEGHMSRECPNAPSQSARACFKCGKEGHMSRECTEPGTRGRGRGRGLPRENAESTNQEISWGQQEPSTNQRETMSWGQPISVQDVNQGTTENPTWGTNPIVVNDQAPVEWQIPSNSEENKPNRDKSSKGCFKCGEEGHMSKECPKNDGQSKGKGCFKCGEEGHMSKECPNKQVRKCFNCGSEEHVSRDCQQEPQIQIPDGPGGSCFKCGNYCHMARDCTGENQEPIVLNDNDDILAQPLPRKKVKIGDPIEIIISDDDSQEQMNVEQSQNVQQPLRLDTLDHIKSGIIKAQMLEPSVQYYGQIEFTSGCSLMCKLISYDADIAFLQTCPPISFLSDTFMTPIQKDYMIYINQLIRLRQEERKEKIRKQYIGIVQGVSEQDDKEIIELAEQLQKSGQSIRISYGIFYSDITFFHIHQVFGDQESITNLLPQLIYVVNLKPKFFQEHENIGCYRGLENL